MIIFPYNTDAPIYYWPYATVGIIITNVLVFVLQVMYPEAAEPYMLQLGDGIHPVQWVTSFFMHGGIGHLLGNMIFLWSFGLVVEGKLGPWKTLLIYLAIGTIESAVSQFVFLEIEPNKALGASTAIYGMMAICLIWAPENSMDCVMVLILFVVVRVVRFELPIKIMVGLYVAMDLAVWILIGGRVSSEFFHVFGAVLGAVAGIALLKTGQVDCEHWDIFSVMTGRHRLTDADRKKIEEEKPAFRKKWAEDQQKTREMLVGEIDRALRSRNALPVLKLRDRMKTEFPEWTLPESDMLLLIQILSDKNMSTEAIALMREYLSVYKRKAVVVRLKLAQTLLDADQPVAALKTLDPMPLETLDDRQRRLHQKLVAKANSLQAADRTSGGYELAD